ncbi:FAD-dependent monooxygenase [Kitasatospora sp. NPDC101155]|uniref:FAD-dependent monooxygenase n=1 Tax=Kitasatospora sp. NPDC101155 TaxID=3364097 RepID=UPI003803A24F
MDTQVIVVGAGPVGLLLAGELRLGGADVVVLERLTAPTTESRASTLHARTMELLDQRGLVEPLDDPACDVLSHFGGLPMELSGPPTRYRGQWKVPQTRLEELLASWALGLGVDLRRGHEVRAVRETDAGVVVEYTTAAGPGTLTGDFLVGCDGEHSTVRALAGFEFPGTDSTRELLRADVAGIEVPNRRFERTSKGLAIAARRPDGVTRIMVHEFGRPAVRRTVEPSFQELAESWATVTGEDLSGGEPLWLNAFGNAARLATEYRRGRVLLAGDAAHRQMPVGGQALNVGLQDAMNLGWKLAAEVGGTAPEGLLDTYHGERHPVGRRVLTAIEAQAQLLLGGPEVDAVRSVTAELLAHDRVRARLGSVISGLDIRYGGSEQPLEGARMPHLDLVTPDGPTSTTELLRPARGVLVDLSADPRRRTRLEQKAAGLQDRIRLISATAAPGSPVPAATLLLRPDGYVAWAGDTTADPVPALHRWFGTPGSQPAH